MVITSKRNGAMNGKDTGFAAVVTELAIRVTEEDLATIATEEFDIGGLMSLNGKLDHDLKLRY